MTTALTQLTVPVMISTAELQIDDLLDATGDRVTRIDPRPLSDTVLVAAQAPDGSFGVSGFGTNLHLMVHRIIGPLAGDMVVHADGLRAGDSLINSNFLVLSSEAIPEKPDSVRIRYETPWDLGVTELERTTLHPVRRGTGRTPRVTTLS